MIWCTGYISAHPSIYHLSTITTPDPAAYLVVAGAVVREREDGELCVVWGVRRRRGLGPTVMKWKRKRKKEERREPGPWYGPKCLELVADTER